MLTPSLHIPILWGVGLLDQKLPGVFQFFQGRVFKSQQQKMREKEECSPRNPACSTCSPSAEGSTSISCRDSPLCCSREGKLWQDFKSCLHGKAPAGKDREHQVLLQRNRWAQGLCSQREGLEVLGVNSLTGVLKAPHLLWHSSLAL